MKKAFNPAIKDKTTNEIFDGISDLLINDNPDLLTITNISKRSGYSIGNIYHHFKNIDEVLKEFVVSRFRSRTHEMQKYLNEIPPSATAKEIIKGLVDEAFSYLTKKLPRTMFIKLAGTILNDSEIIKRIDEVCMSSVDLVETLINKNETNTFKKLTHAEIELAILMCSSAVRKPITQNHKLALSKSHKEQVAAILIASFAR